MHPAPARLQCDLELRAILLNLYDEREEVVWAEVVAPYIEAHRPALENVLREHARDPSWNLLDTPEVLLLLERADRDRERLRLAWPGPASVLARLSDVWGVPL